MKQFIFLMFSFLLANQTQSQNKFVKLEDSPAAYKALGLLKDSVQLWENGSRVSTAKGNYETWYYRANLEDSSCITIFFLMRDLKKMNKIISPHIIVEIVFANGKKIEKNIYCKPEEFKSSTDSCDVHIGNNYFVRNANAYTINIEDSILKMNISFEGTVPPWRPKTGHLTFGNKGNFYGWVLPVPKGKTQVTYTYKGITTSTQGICFHDHNWGNTVPYKLYNNFYWVQSNLGPYKVYVAEITAPKKFNYESQPFFAVFKNDKLLFDDETQVTYLKSKGIKQPIGNREVSDVVAYKFKDGDSTYDVVFKKQQVITSENVIKNKLLRKLVKFFTSFDGSWYRIEYEAFLKKYHNSCIAESYTSNEQVWMELFYLGKSN